MIYKILLVAALLASSVLFTSRLNTAEQKSLDDYDVPKSKTKVFQAAEAVVKRTAPIHDHGYAKQTLEKWNHSFQSNSDESFSYGNGADQPTEAPFLTALRNEGVDDEAIEAFFRNGEPAHLQYWKNGSAITLANTATPGGFGNGVRRMLRFADESSIQHVVEQRLHQSQEIEEAKEVNEKDKIHREEVEPADLVDKHTAAQPLRLGPDSYAFLRFSPGYMDDNETIIGRPTDPNESARGPDYLLDGIDASDQDALLKLRRNVISLGHGGEIVFEVANEGWIADEKGADFIIFENPFRYGPGLIFQELAAVGVALEDKDDSYTWFPCAPHREQVLNCAGVVPTSEGGDAFDLSVVGIERVRFIKIRDVGTTQNMGGPQTEGFDFDALSLIHAYRNPK